MNKEKMMDKKMAFVASVAALLAAAALTACAGARVEAPPQIFDAGGWKLDVQFMDVMGSPYLLAHGAGMRVTDAKASVAVPESGKWRVWVRSRKWTDGAGAFNVSVGGTILGKTFGVSQSEWDWEYGGEVELDDGRTAIRLMDCDGFDGRCAGVVLEKDGGRPEGALSPASAAIDDEEEFDFVVVGGGMPGTCAAVAAARRGLKVALVQDRPVLGGNASAEIRVWSAGEARYPLVKELRGWFMNRESEMFLSDSHRMRVVEDEKTLSVFLRHRVFAADVADGAISSVKALDCARNRVVRFKAPLFCDATGDGWLGFYAGAEWRMGREAKAEYGESFAPEKADGHTLGASLMWKSSSANTEIPFSAPWAEPHAQGISAINGEWNWEYGIRRDMIEEGEAIRDRLLLAVYGAFSLAKKDPANSKRVIDTLPFLLGKRESRRLVGDWVYSEKDITEKRLFEDAIAAGSWSVDLHYDDCRPGVDFLTTCRQPHYGRYWIPYRSIYSRNIRNLFMAGRCFSCTHVGLGGPRVINTLSQLGCAAGEAAAICRERGILPRDVWKRGLVRELQIRLGGEFPGHPDPALAGWAIVDDETPGVEFGDGWKFWHFANGEQVGDGAHCPPGGSGWGCVIERGVKCGDAVYPLPVAKPGRYVLMGRVPYISGMATEISETSMSVESAGRTTEFKVNQTVGMGTWRRLGVFDLAPGAKLRIVPSASRGTVIADGFAVLPATSAAAGDVKIENRRFSLVVGGDATVKSLVLKSSGRECVPPDSGIRLFSVTQPRPFNNEIKLIHPNKRTVYQADSIEMRGDGELVAGFEMIPYEARVRVRATDEYVEFRLEGFIVENSDYEYLQMDLPPADSFRVLQLPVSRMKNFGDWLNASWDETAAVGVAGVSPHADIDHENRPGFRILSANLLRDIRMEGASAALIAADGREDFLDCMDALERDFGLPRGVQSRRSPHVNASIYHLSGCLSPGTIEKHIEWAKRGGFRYMTFYCSDVVQGAYSWALCGNYDLRKDLFPGGFDDLRKMLSRIKEAGIHPGFHFLHPHIGLKSRYATPVADPRLRKKRRYTLASPLPAGTNDAELAVLERADLAPRHPECRVLQFGGELMTYESAVPGMPGRFLGVKRGAFGTAPQQHEAGQVGGVLDISEFGKPMSCYIDQDTDLQDEVAKKLAAIYDCGFEYVYFDGSEGVNPPCNFHVANAQYRVWKALGSEPLFAEGAAKTHFGWHMLSGANAFDVFPPEVFKAKIVEFPVHQAPLSWQDMTRVNFGWWLFEAPGKDGRTGTQMDMYEFASALCYAWDCPATVQARLHALENHPRAKDCFEVLRRWEDARMRQMFPAEVKERLKDASKAHHLRPDGKGGYELHEIEMLPDCPGAKDIRGFMFVSDGETVLAAWDVRGESEVAIDLGGGSKRMRFADLAYHETSLGRDEVRKAWLVAKETDMKEKSK